MLRYLKSSIFFYLRFQLISIYFEASKSENIAERIINFLILIKSRQAPRILSSGSRCRGSRRGSHTFLCPPGQQSPYRRAVPRGAGLRPSEVAQGAGRCRSRIPTRDGGTDSCGTGVGERRSCAHRAAHPSLGPGQGQRETDPHPGAATADSGACVPQAGRRDRYA